MLKQTKLQTDGKQVIVLLLVKRNGKAGHHQMKRILSFLEDSQIQEQLLLQYLKGDVEHLLLYTVQR